MNLVERLQNTFASYLETTFGVAPDISRSCTLVLNTDEAKQAFGDLSSNAAMILARPLGLKPRDIAQKIIDSFSDESVARIEIAGPGFLNIFLHDTAYATLAGQLFELRTAFFKPSPDEHKRSVLIEFVSANPTGPLHFGHGRGGIIGDVLANVLTFSGHRTLKEFYINDAGSQIQKLGNSFKIRCMQAAGKDVALPEDAYHGAYLLELAKKTYAQLGAKLLDMPDSFFAEHAKEIMLVQVKETLTKYGITFDSWFSEKQLHEDGSIERALAELDKAGHLYTQDDATWFRSTTFGDDKDRVLQKGSGEKTYAAADVAYLANKITRGYDDLVMILGHDHHSYAVRLQSILHALGLAQAHHLYVILYQLVKIKEGGEQVRMSKRAGKIVDLDGIIETVGKDVARFFYLNRKADAQLEFDVDLALKRTDENPVYYIQYAYVRTKSILAKAQQEDELASISAEDAQYLGGEEALIIKKIVSLKPLLADICRHHQTHLLAYYIHELAQLFNRYYNKHRIIVTESVPQSRGRLLLTHVLKNTFETVLTLLGISCPERM